jgi:hypothetical protein
MAAKGDSLVFTFKVGSKFSVTFTVPPVRASTKPEIIIHSRWVPYMPANLTADEQADYEREKTAILDKVLGMIGKKGETIPYRIYHDKNWKNN